MAAAAEVLLLFDEDESPKEVPKPPTEYTYPFGVLGDMLSPLPTPEMGRVSTIYSTPTNNVDRHGDRD
jgi:hypothetical protein